MTIRGAVRGGKNVKTKNFKFAGCLLLVVVLLLTLVGCDTGESPSSTDDTESFYTITFTTEGGGSISLEMEEEETKTSVEGSYEFDRDSSINLTAIPDQDWEFSHWDGEVSEPENAETKVLVNANKSIKAVFVTEDQENDEPGYTEEMSESGTFGPGKGGTLELDNQAKISFPENAFATDVEITFALIDSQPEITAAATSIYNISGIADLPQEPLEIFLPLEITGASSKDNFKVTANSRAMMVLHGNETHHPANHPPFESGTERKVVPADFSEEFARAQLQDAEIIGDAFALHVEQGNAPVPTEGPFNFHVTDPSDSIRFQDLEAIAEGLDKAYDFLTEDLGLSFDGGPDTIEVQFYEFNSYIGGYLGDSEDAWGYLQYPVRLTRNRSLESQYITLNTRKLSEPDAVTQFQATAAHELFHLVQQLYLPNFSDHHWLQEAASVWLEFQMIEDDQFWPDVISREDMVWFPVNGMLRDSNTYANSSDEHGYAASLFLKYLSDEKGNRAIGDLWRSAATGSPSWALFRDAFDNYLWYEKWPEFINNLYQGKYSAANDDPGYSVRQLHIDGQVGISSWYVDDPYENSENKFETALYPLTARTASIFLRYGDREFEEDTEANLIITNKSDQQYPAVLQVYQIEGDDAVYLGESKTGQPFEISDLVEFDRAHLSIVTASAWTPTGHENIATPVSFTAEIKIEEEEIDFPDANLEAAIREIINKPTGPIFKTDVWDIEALLLSQRDIASIEGLEHFESLQYLDIRTNQISDISPLQDLTKMQFLNLDRNQISDLSPVENFTELNTLWAQHNEISDISPLENLTELDTLGIESNNIDDLSPLAGLTKLESLRLHGNEVSNLGPLSDLTKLETLIFSNNEVSYLTPIAELTNLKYLHFSGNNVSSLSSLYDLTELIALSFSDNQVSAVSNLSQLKNLDRLTFDRNQVTSINLEGLENLTQLRFSENQVSDISALSELDNLLELIFNDNLVEDLSPLAGLSNLEDLEFRENLVSSIESLEDLQALEILDFSHNQVVDISALANLTNLSRLGARDNQINDIGALLDNQGLGSGTSITLIENDLELWEDSETGEISSDLQDIKALQDRGANVLHDEIEEKEETLALSF